jgi:DNA-binding MarR family transcriptional regulator
MTNSTDSFPGDARPAPGVQVRHGVAQLLQWASRGEFRRFIFGPAASDLSPTDAALLEYLTRHGPLRLSDLAVQWGVNKSTMNPQVGRLEARGLVDRRPDPTDRRASLLSTSADGRELQRRIGEAGAAAFEEILSAWPQEDREAFGSMLIRFANDISAASPRLFQTAASADRGSAATDNNDPERTDLNA